MDFLSLPDEMNAAILKYSDYTTVNLLRKTNCRLNNIAIAYDIGIRFPVPTIRFTSGNYGDITSWGYDIDLSSIAVACHPNLLERNIYEISKVFNKDDGPHLNIIDNLLRKIDLRGALYFASCSFIVDDQLLQVFRNNQTSLRNMHRFILNDTRTDNSNSAVYNCFSCFRKLRDYLFRCSATNIDAFCNTELFEKRHWENVSLRCENVDTLSTTLNDDFLWKAVKNIQRLTVEFGEKRRTSFTINGVVEMIKTLIADEVVTEFANLGRIYTNDHDLYKHERKIRSIDNNIHCTFERGYEVDQENGIDRRIAVSYCRISQLWNPQNDFIRFTICCNN